jgi:signal transduction histidine kinase/DNA-binding NarL/FixJ family response regulator
MKRLSLPAKIGFLMAMSMALICATGYLSFRSLSAIVASIQVKTRPDLRLLTIREISGDLEKAENSVRLYLQTRKQKDIESYYASIERFDDKINELRSASISDTTLLTQIDTISRLIEQEILIWNRMLNLYHNDSLDIFIRKLTSRIAVGSLSSQSNDRSILRRVFSKKPDSKPLQEEIIRDLKNIEEKNSIQNDRLLAAESNLALTGHEIRERFYILVSQMEEELARSISSNAMVAEKLAMKAYRWLSMFALLGTLLVILVVVIVVRYVRKSHDYQVALVRSKEETEKLARTKELFMANMSHEIRTPVNAIYGFAEQLLQDSFDEKSREMIGIIKASADHLVKIVNDVLDFSRLENAGITLERSHFITHKVFEEVQLLFMDKASANGTRLSYSISKSTPLVLLGDPYRLKQILINLVGNAVKFTSNGNIHYSADSEMKSDHSLQLILKVADTGIGIGEDMLEKVFDDFMQAESDTSRKFGGTGLGLSIVKRLVELHGGTISLNSRKGQGTTVTCILPYAAGSWEQLPVPLKATGLPEKFSNLKLLVVDDEAYNRMLFRTILDRWKVRYEEASDGLKALELLKSSPFDLVFMDVRMPGLDGLKTTAIIRNKLGKTQADLPVIGFSATQNPKEQEECRLAGMNAFLRKPFSEEMLVQVIHSVLESGTKKSVDLSSLYHLANHDVPFIKQMLTGFIESTEQGLQEIRSAIDGGDAVKAMEAAHRLTAPCRHIGADELYTCLKMIEEEAGNHKNMAKLAELSEALHRVFPEIKLFLQDHILKMDE